MTIWNTGDTAEFTLPEARVISGEMAEINYTLTGLPAGLMFDPMTREVTGTITAAAGITGTAIYTATTNDIADCEPAVYRRNWRVIGTPELPDAAWTSSIITRTGNLHPDSRIMLVATENPANVYDRVEYGWASNLAQSNFEGSVRNVNPDQDTVFYNIPKDASGSVHIFLITLIYGQGVEAKEGTSVSGFTDLELELGLPLPTFGLNNDYRVEPNLAGSGYGRVNAPSFTDDSVYDGITLSWRGGSGVSILRSGSDSVDAEGFVNTGNSFVAFGYSGGGSRYVELKIVATGDGTTAQDNAVATAIIRFDVTRSTFGRQLPGLIFTITHSTASG